MAPKWGVSAEKTQNAPALAVRTGWALGWSDAGHRELRPPKNSGVALASRHE